jgi:hypothetical protein
MRSVYFSFHYDDIWKVNQIRHSGLVVGSQSAGFQDSSLWEKAKTKNRRALEDLIEDGLNGTSVTAVLIGQETADRDWVKHEIKRSVERGNALLGIHIHCVPERNGRITRRGKIPYLLKKHSAPIHDWTNVRDFGTRVEEAWQSQKNPGVLDQIAKFLFG